MEKKKSALLSSYITIQCFQFKLIGTLFRIVYVFSPTVEGG